MFLDEADALLGARGEGGVGEHEASRRSKAEFLIQLDGLANNRQEADGVWINAGPVYSCYFVYVRSTMVVSFQPFCMNKNTEGDQTRSRRRPSCFWPPQTYLGQWIQLFFAGRKKKQIIALATSKRKIPGKSNESIPQVPQHVLHRAARRGRQEKDAIKDGCARPRAPLAATDRFDRGVQRVGPRQGLRQGEAEDLPKVRKVLHCMADKLHTANMCYITTYSMAKAS